MLVFGLVGFKSNQDNSINLTVDKLNVNLTEDNIRELVNWLTWHQQRSAYIGNGLHRVAQVPLNRQNHLQGNWDVAVDPNAYNNDAIAQQAPR